MSTVQTWTSADHECFQLGKRFADKLLGTFQTHFRVTYSKDWKRVLSNVPNVAIIVSSNGIIKSFATPQSVFQESSPQIYRCFEKQQTTDSAGA